MYVCVSVCQSVTLYSPTLLSNTLSFLFSVAAANSDVPIIGNNRLIDRKAVDYDDRFSIINNRSSDACTKHVYNKIHMHNKAT